MLRRHGYIAIFILCVLSMSLSGCNHLKKDKGASFTNDSYTVYPDSVVDGLCVSRAITPYQIISTFPTGDTIRVLRIHETKDFPRYSSKSMITDAVINMSLWHLDSVSSKQSTVNTALTVELAMCYLNPDKAKEMLRSCVKDGFITQGYSYYGGWPVKVDGIAWISAAWELYKITGDKEWLTEAYTISVASLSKYKHVTFDAATGLYKGASANLIYAAKPAYPDWMTGADIASSTALSINAMTYKALMSASWMASKLGFKNDATRWKDEAVALRESVNTSLWQPNRGTYGQYLYSQPYPIVSVSNDNLAQGLAMTYEIATQEMQREIMQRTAVAPLGLPYISPQLPDSSQSYSSSLLPAADAYWAIASSKVKNAWMLYRNLFSLVRSASMNLGNYPCYDLKTGQVPGALRQRNNEAVSAAANVAAIYRGLLGMRFSEDSIYFEPLILNTSNNLSRKVEGLRYRKAILDINVEGSGSMITSFKVDSIDQAAHGIPGTLRGHHTIDILMSGNTPNDFKINESVPQQIPSTPSLRKDGRQVVSLSPFIDGIAYQVYLNGTFEEQIFASTYKLSQITGFTTLNIQPVKDEEYEGYASAPTFFVPQGYSTTIPADSLAFPGTTLIKDKAIAKKFAETTESKRSRMSFKFNAPTKGTYILQCEYSNAWTSATMLSDLCALRQVEVNGQAAGMLIMPPTIKDDWAQTALSNFVTLNLSEGRNDISIVYKRPWTVNGHVSLNTALIKRVIIYRL